VLLALDEKELMTLDQMWSYAAQLAMLSLFSVGGANVVLPEIHRYVVLQRAWLVDAQFSSLVALSQAAPGPNVLVVAVIGYQIGGLLPAAVALLAFVLPSSLLTLAITHLGGRVGKTPWTRILRRGLGPLTSGLVLANGFILTGASGAGRAALPIALLTAFLSVRTRLNPVWIILMSGAAGAMIL
jgi:chromate transporter